MALTITKEPTNPCFSKNIIAFQVQTTTTLPVKARVFFETAPYSDTYEFLVELKAIPDSDGYCVFYLEGDLESDVLVYDKPNFTDTLQIMTKSCRRFKVDFYEYDSTALVQFSEVYASEFTVLAPFGKTMSTGTDYVIKTSYERASLILRPDVISLNTEKIYPLYRVNDETWFSVNPSYDHAYFGALAAGEKVTIYEGTPPTLETSSVRFAILAGLEYERFAILTANSVLWGNENYDLIIDSDGNFIGLS